MTTTTAKISSEKVTLHPASSYQSKQVQEQKKYKYYNNTYLYVSFRKQFYEVDADGNKLERADWPERLKVLY